MADICYRFHIRIGNFQFEVEGERSFVERTLTRYEGRFLPKFQQLLDKIPAIEIVQKTPHPVEEARIAVPQRHEPEPVQEREKEREGERNRDRGREPRKDSRRFDNKDRRGRDRDNRRRGPKDRSSNSRVMPAPLLPRDQEVIKTPYIPPDGFEMSNLSDDEAIPPPVPLLQRITDEMKRTEKQEVVRELAVVTDEDIEEEDGPAVLLEGDQSEDSLKRFYETLNPRTHHEKIMVFGYFLQVRRGMKEFGTGKIKSCYDAAGSDPTGNINQVLNHASRTGFVTKFQRGRSVKYSLTSKGKQFVERGLQSA